MPRQRRSPLRFVKQAVICLLLGAVVTVGVASGLAKYWSGRIALTPVYDSQSLLLTETDGYLAFMEYQPGLSQLYIEARSTGAYHLSYPGIDPVSTVDALTIPRWAQKQVASLSAQPRSMVEDPVRDMQVSAFGWPARALMRGESRHFPIPGGPVSGEPDYSEPVLRLHELGFDLQPNRRLLTRPLSDVKAAKHIEKLGFAAGPIWRGLIINTLFHAFVIWLLWMLPGWIRHVRRRVRGSCLACGYILHDAATVCSECGEPTGRAAKAATPGATASGA